MALAERWLAAQFNRAGFPLVDHCTYVIAGDGDLMEGISHEAASLAGHLGLGKLIVLYDDNSISLVGPTSLSFSENTAARFAAYGWQVLQADGHDTAQVAAALAEARNEPSRPTIIITRTTIGFASPRAGSHKAHGEPLGADGVAQTKAALGWTEPPFSVPDAVYEHMHAAVDAGAARQREWQALFDRYRVAFPELAARWEQMHNGGLPADWSAALPAFPPDAKAKGTRSASGTVLQQLAAHVPGLIGGSADLHSSDMTFLEAFSGLSRDDFSGRNIYYGVREHAMGAALNGLALHGGLIPYGGTFLVFSDYLRPAIRLAALMGLRVVYVFTHDSIGVGEDGPTHQPVEQVAALRLIPNLQVIRPGDANETAQAWRMALERQDGPTALILSRQNVVTQVRTADAPAELTARGGYLLQQAAGARAAIIASGSELQLAVAAAEQLTAAGMPTNVVSMPCRELFLAQDAAYRAQVLPQDVSIRVVMEAGRGLGWERIVGNDAALLTVERFGASAPAPQVYELVGLTVAQAVAAVQQRWNG
jgi:transketolase